MKELSIENFEQDFYKLMYKYRDFFEKDYWFDISVKFKNTDEGIDIALPSIINLTKKK